jgi:protein-export membrane protein SecD
MAQMKKISRVRLTVAAIVIAAVVLMLFDFPQIWDKSVDALNSKLGTEFVHFKNIPFRLGLDLQGGTQLVYEADTSKITDSKSEAVEGLRDVVERRVNAFGVSEPVVQVNKSQDKYRILVELAGISDVNEAIKMIGETPLLEFKEANTEPQRELTAEEKKTLETYNKDAKAKIEKALKESLAGKDFAEAAKEYTESDIGKEIGGDLGWINKSGEYFFLIDAASKTEVGKVYPKVIDQAGASYVIKVNETREGDKEVKANHLLICFAGATSCTSETSKEDALKQIQELKAKATPKNFVQLVKENSTEPGADTGGGDLGWFGKDQMVKPFSDAVFAMDKGTVSDVVETDFGYHLIYKADEKPIIDYKVSNIVVKKQQESDILPPADAWKSTGLTGKNLKTSLVEFDPNTREPNVALRFDDEGKKLFAEITRKNIGKQVAIFVDGSVVSSPNVSEAITGGEAVITGKFDIAEAKDLVRRLNAGALPVPIKLVSQQTVGASLGSESLQKSLFAGLIGYLAVILFMIFYYRLPGVLASIALIIYGVLVLFIFKSIPVTLTLSGIAGFILSVGMAVDANILIFERTKEELRIGKPLGTAIEEGFKRAWPSIRDSNVTTLISCFVLAWFGTSIVKGFAITLGIGVICSMFSAIVVTRHLLGLLSTEKIAQRMWLFGNIQKKTE